MNLEELSIPRVFDLLPDPICVFDISGKILVSNKEFQNSVISVKRGEHISFVDDLIHNEDKINFRNVVQKSESSKSQNFTSAVRTLTSEKNNDFPVYRRYIWSISYELGSGKIIACGRIVNALESQCEQSRESDVLDFFQYSPKALHWLSSTGMILWANQTELNILEYSAEEYIGHPFSKFCLQEDEVVVKDIFSSGTDIPKDTLIRCVSKSGHIKPRLLSTVITPKGRAFFLKEAPSTPSSSSLSHNQSEAILEAEREAAQRTYTAKDEFVMQAFFDVRAQLQAVKDTLSRMPKTNSDARNLQLQTDHVASIIEDLAFVTRCDSGKILAIRPVPTQIEGVIRDTYAKLIGYQFKNKKVEFELNIQGIPGDLSADSSLRRVIHHLMANALAYSVSNSTVQLNASFQPIQSPDSVVSRAKSPVSPPKPTRNGRTLRKFESAQKRGLFHFRITNNVSTPMDIEEIHASFQRYYSSKLYRNNKVSNGVRQQKGFGIGLNVAYNMVQMMGGLLECSATQTESSFWFSVEMTIGSTGLTPKPPRHVSSSTFENSPSSRSDGNSEEWTTLHDSDVANQFILDELGVGYVSPTEYSRKITLSNQGASKSGGGSIGGGKGAASSPSRKCRILVVDDNTICQKVLVNTLKRLGIDSDVAGNGKEAVDKLAVIPLMFDAVLMDLHMPIMDGLTATRTCRTELKLTLPIIVLTADVGTDGREENAIKAGVDVFLSKPATVNTLKEVLKQFNLA